MLLLPDDSFPRQRGGGCSMAKEEPSIRRKEKDDEMVKAEVEAQDPQAYTPVHHRCLDHAIRKPFSEHSRE